MEKKKKTKKIKKIIIIFIMSFLLFFAFLLFFCAYMLSAVSNDKKEENIIIPQGATFYDIASILKDNNLIKNERIFVYYLKFSKVDNIYAASYYLSPSMNVKEIVDVLLDGGHNENEISITFNEGINMRKIASIIDSNTNNSYDEVMSKLKDNTYLDSLISKYWFLTEDIKNKQIYYSLEGYLFPETYHFNDKDVSIEEIFDKMLTQMDEVLKEYKEKIETSELSIHKLITLASITQSEGYNEDDFKNIASVFYNRLNANMALGSCVTSYYGVKKDMTDELYQSEIDASNPYNTRGYNPVNFPAGPISIPGNKALAAVIIPVKTDYYYFVSDKNNKLYFTKTLSEHEKMISKLQNEGSWYEW